MCLFEQFLFVLCLQSSLFRKISRGLPSRGGESWRSWWEVSRLGSLRGGQPCFCFCLVVVALSRPGNQRGGQFFLCVVWFLWCFDVVANYWLRSLIPERRSTFLLYLFVYFCTRLFLNSHKRKIFQAPYSNYQKRLLLVCTDVIFLVVVSVKHTKFKDRSTLCL